MKKRLLAIFAAAAVSTVTLCACSEEAEEDINSYTKTMYTFGTEVTLRLYGDFNSSEAQNGALSFATEVQKYLSALEGSTSTSSNTSSVYAFNSAGAGETVQLDEDTYNILSIALDIYKETDGYYNAGVYYNVNIFGFGEDGTYSGVLPDYTAVTAYTELASSFGDISLYTNDGKYYAVKPDRTVKVNGAEYSLSIDLGGIAKGYAAEEVYKMMEENGYIYGYISFGSSSMYIGQSYTSSDGLWSLNVRNPRSVYGDSFMSVRLAEMSVSTSGDYENYYEVDGVRFSHIINPYTGLPVNVAYSGGDYSQTAGIISATVLGGSAAENDARTTALMAMGLDNAVEYINSEEVMSKDLQIYMVYLTAEGNMQLITNVAESGFTISNNSSITLASALGSDGKVTYTG